VGDALAPRLRRASLTWASMGLDLTSRAARRLPRRVRYLAADAVAGLVAGLWIDRRSIAEQNFALLLDLPATDPRVAGLARRSFQNFGRMAIDFLVVRAMSAEEILTWVEPVGEDHLARALRGGRGAILVVPHVGSWDVAAAFAAACGYDLTIVTESTWAAELVAGSRRSRHITLVPRTGSVRPVFSALARNEAVVLLGDLARPGLETAEVAFFGRPASFPIGPARLALRTGAAVLVASSVRLPDGRYRVEARPPLPVDPERPSDEAIQDLTARIARDFERVIAAYPEQWYPFSPIWARATRRACASAAPPGGLRQPRAPC
jgi:KDO2-lipid IV(A) lauroyltransferase